MGLGNVIGSYSDGDDLSSVSKKLRYDDMNVGTGGVARGTTIITGAAATTVYSYSGSGVLTGFIINLASANNTGDNWQINLVVDGDEVFNSTGLNSTDIVGVYNYNTAGNREPSSLGLEINDTVISFQSPLYPIRYSSSVVIQVKKTTGGNKAFNAGLVLLTKET